MTSSTEHSSAPTALLRRQVSGGALHTIFSKQEIGIYLIKGTKK